MPSECFKKGLGIRKEVLGEEHVDNSFNSASDFSKPLQDLVTEFCFGAVWGREGLSRRDRSLINIALLTAAGRSHALHHHVIAALTNGATEEEIRETLVHVIPYSGFPAAFDAFEIAERALKQTAPEQAAKGTRPGKTQVFYCSVSNRLNILASRESERSTLRLGNPSRPGD